MKDTTGYGIVGVSYATTPAVVAAVRADLVVQGFQGPVYFGKQFLKQHRDPTLVSAGVSGTGATGTVVMFPIGRSPLGAPRMQGGNPRPTFTVTRAMEIHCTSQAPPLPTPNSTAFATQYEADLALAEILTAAVVRSFEILIPGAKRGGQSDITDAGENIQGVEIVTTLGVDLELPDTTYQVATGATFAPGYMMQFPDGTTDSGSDQF